MVCHCVMRLQKDSGFWDTVLDLFFALACLLWHRPAAMLCTYPKSYERSTWQGTDASDPHPGRT